MWLSGDVQVGNDDCEPGSSFFYLISDNVVLDGLYCGVVKVALFVVELLLHWWMFSGVWCCCTTVCFPLELFLSW